MARRRKKYTIGIQDSTPLTRRGIYLAILTVLFFLVICLGNLATIKPTALVLICLAILGGLVCFPVLRERIRLPIIALFLVVLVSGISTAYALSGKFALRELLKIIIALCVALLFTVIFPGEGVGPGRRIALILEGSTAFAALLSVDLISTRFLSDPILGLLININPEFSLILDVGVLPGVRMLSIFENPNVFGGCAGIGVLLALGLVLSSQGKKERCFHLCCLYITATAFILVFSMGAIAAIIVAFLAYLLLEHKDRRSELLLLMIKTFILVLISVFIVSATSFGTWDGIQPIPLLCLIVGSVLLCLADRFVGHKLTEKLRGGFKSLIVVGVAVILLVAFVLTAYNWTGPISMAEGENIRRAVSPDPGEYTVSAEGGDGLQVTIESYTREEVLTASPNVLYEGDLSAARFTVPEDSQVVYFSITAPQGAALDSLRYVGDQDSGKVPLEYKLLPGFMVSRIQGLFASPTAIQRFSLFEDGLELFKQSPIYGLGLGSFETALYSVQTFFTETKYVHNHYIQTMMECGIIGLIFFVGLLGVSGTAIILSRKKENFHPLTPALGAALTFMAVHGFVEVVFSTYQYLPLAYGVFAMINLCCGDAIPTPWLNKKVRTAIVIVALVLLLVFSFFLGSNMGAHSLVEKTPTFTALQNAASMDKFEWADHALSYVMSSVSTEVPEEITQQAAVYAERLSKVTSNAIPLYLIQYYFAIDDVDSAMAMAEKHANYLSASSEAWNSLFHTLLSYVNSTDPAFHEGVLRLFEILDHQNAVGITKIQLDDASQAFVDALRGS